MSEISALSASATLDPAVGQGSFLRRIAPLFLAMLLAFATIGMPLPALPLHVAGPLGFGTAIAGLTVGLQSFATVLTRAPSGRLVDRKGAKLTLAYGLIASAGAGALYCLSDALTALPSLLVLLAGRLVLGIGESLFITGILSWAIVRSGPGRTGRAMAWNGMAQYASLAISAPIGFALYQRFGFFAVSLSTLLLPLAALGVVLPLDPAPPSGGRRLPLLSVVGPIWKPGLGLMLAGIGFASVTTFASLDFVDRGWPGAGFALLAFGACFVAVRLVAGDLPDRLGGRVVAMGSLATEVLGQLLLWVAPHPLLALLGAGLTGLGTSLNFPAFGVEAFRRVAPESRGIAVGAFAAFQDVAIGLTGPVLGGIAAAWHPSAVFAVGALTSAAGLAVAATLGPGATADGRP